MTPKKLSNIATALIGIALVLPVFIAVPMLGMGYKNVSINATLISSQVPQTGVGFQPGAIVGPGSAYPKFLVAPNGTGFCVWLETKDILSTDGTHVFIGSVENATTNMTIKIMQTTAPVYSANGWKSWNLTAIKTLNSVYQLSHRGFLDAAFDKSGKLWVFFSSQVVESGPNFLKMVPKIWDGGSTLSPVTSDLVVLNWTSGLAPLSSDGMGVSIASRGAAGQILFDKDGGRHLLWNNGRELWYRCNSSGVPQKLATADYMGECSMAINSTKHLIVVYAAGNTTVSNKVIYSRTATWANMYTDFNTPVAISSDAGKECLTPYVFVDSSNTPHYLWSAKEDTTTHRYVVKLKRGSNPAVNISTDYGGLVASPNKAMAWKPCGAYYRGKLNIFYADNTTFTGIGGGDQFKTNILWQSYSNLGDLSNNKAVVLSNQESYDDLNPSIALPINTDYDDMYVIYGSYGSLQRVNIVNIDEVAPSITVTSPLRTEVPLSYTLTFTASNAHDLANITVKCGNYELILDPDVRAVDLPASLLVRESYPLLIEAMDDVGNKYQFIGVLEFTSIPPELIITIAVVAGAAVLVVLVLLYYKKNKENLMRRGLGLKMGGKPAEEKTWGEEGAEEEEAGGGEEGSVDLKKDLKKVDM
nr:hypothetical protein [Candidatus Sigynarchaeum springense]